MTLVRNPTKRAKRKNLLVFGYTREETTNMRQIPIALIKVFESFYDELIHWKFPKTIVGYNQRELQYGPKFTFNNITFQLAARRHLYGWYYPRHSRPIQFYLIMDTKKDIPLNMLCFEFTTAIKSNICGDKDKDDDSVYDAPEQQKLLNFDMDKLRRDGGYYYDYKGWIFAEISGSEVADNKEDDISISLELEIMDITYCKIDTYSYLKWEFDEDEMKDFDEDPLYGIDSDRFGKSNTWMIELYPCQCPKHEFYIERPESRTVIKIDIPKLPLNIGYFKAMMKLKIKSDQDQVVFDQIVKCNKQNKTRKRGHCAEYLLYNCLYQRFMNAKKIMIECEIEIRNVYDNEGVEIEKKEWIKYGIVDGE